MAKTDMKKYRREHPEAQLRWRIQQAINLLSRAETQAAVQLAMSAPKPLDRLPVAMDHPAQDPAAAVAGLVHCGVVDTQATGDQIRILCVSSGTTYTLTEISGTDLALHTRKLTDDERIAAKLYVPRNGGDC